MSEARHHALRLLLYDTCLPIESILGAFMILDKAETPTHGASPRYRLDDLMAAAYVAYKVYTTNCSPTRTDFRCNLLTELQPCVRRIDMQAAELRMMESVAWTVPSTTRYDCVLALMYQMAAHDETIVRANDCTICKGPVENPTQLPCGHMCCRGCIATMVCNGFPRTHVCPACCQALPEHAHAHYITMRTMMPLKLEIDRALGYSLLAPHIANDGLYARAVLWAAVHLTCERKYVPALPSWETYLYDDEQYTRRNIALAGISISTAYDRGAAGTLVLPPVACGKKRKHSPDAQVQH